MNLRQERRRELFAEQNGLCCLCGALMHCRDPRHRDYATFEHMQDRHSPGGRSGKDGTVSLSHRRCNAERNRARQLQLKERRASALKGYSKRDKSGIWHGTRVKLSAEATMRLMRENTERLRIAAN